MLDMPAALAMRVIRDPAQFDRQSGHWLERLIFNHRAVLLLLCAALTALLGWHALQLRVNADFEHMIPRSHPYVRNMLAHESQLRGLGNTLQVVLQNTRGDIYDPAFLRTLREANDRLYLMPEVDRATMRSLWMPNVRWAEVTEDGYRGGPVMPDGWDGSPAAMQLLKANVARAGLIGSYVALDQRSTLIHLPLLPRVQETGRAIDYGAFSRKLEREVRSLESGTVKVRMVGFAKIAGDLIEGLRAIAACFAASVVVSALLMWSAIRCLRSTALLVACALLGVVWLLGLMQWRGNALDPYTVLLPFLVFAIGLSHGAQKMNGILQDVGRGTHRYVAARYTFRRLFLPGLTALLANGFGFALLYLVDIPVIRELAAGASMGMAVLVITKLMLVPVALSVIGVSPVAAARSLRQPVALSRAGAAKAQPRGRQQARDSVRGLLLRLVEPGPAAGVLAATVLLSGAALWLRQDLQFGDLHAGAPELRANSRYNVDARFVAAGYDQSSDPFVVMLSTPPGGCFSYETLVEADRLGAAMRELPGVTTTVSAADAARLALAGQFEGNLKWLSFSRNPSLLGAAVSQVQFETPALVDQACSLLPVIAYLADHRAETLSRTARAAEQFALAHDGPQRRFLLAAGSAGIQAATNSVVAQTFWRLHLALYAAVALLCALTFRDWRATVVALLPLLLTSLLCEALMVALDMGIKVSTLPVVAVGIGVGVDYALYLISVQLGALRGGATLAQAWQQALDFTGRMVALIALTLAAGVLSWQLSPIQFQADMGLLLAFMLLWNMVGALVLLPALSCFLLGGRKLATPA